MSDFFQSLVAPDIAAADAKPIGDRMLQWLVAEQIVLAETIDCVLGADAGHPPGPDYAKATGTTDPLLLRLQTNGLALITKRTVFHSGQGSVQLICSACKSTFDLPDRWHNAVDEWFKQTGPGDLACPVCAVSRPIDQWQHDPPWAFGELAIEFWNWPAFTPAFIAEFEKRLGSRIVHVYGKL
jgi:hypothetical protein